MTDRKTQMLEDKYLRDSAKALFDADVNHLKADLAQKGVGTRLADRAREGAVDIYEEALVMADDHKGALAALVAAIVVWFARHPLLSAIGVEPEEDAAEPDWRDRVTERFSR